MSNMRYSIIIPQKDSLDTLKRLIDSIPYRDDLEIIVVDNSPKSITYEDIGTKRPIDLHHCPAEKYAGGARNTGMAAAKGEWLVFADADDFFTPTAFDSFDKYAESKYDLVYFKVNSVYSDTLEVCNRGDMFSEIVDKYNNREITDIETRLLYTVPWGKMVRSALVRDNNIQFDEVLAANDVMFSTLVGYYATSFCVSTDIVYTLTVRKGSLAMRKGFDVTLSRFNVTLRRNRFLKDHGLSNYQSSVMTFLFHSISAGIDKPFILLYKALKNRQNIFIGATNWIKTYKRLKEEKRKRYNYQTE